MLKQTVVFHCSGPGLGHSSRCESLAEVMRVRFLTEFRFHGEFEVDRHSNLRPGDEGVTDVSTEVVVAVIDVSDQRLAATINDEYRARGIRTVCIADAGFEIECSLFVCPGPQVLSSDFGEVRADRLLLGPAFGLISEVFRKEWTSDPTTLKFDVLIALGGTVPTEAVEPLANCLENAGYKVAVVAPGSGEGLSDGTHGQRLWNIGKDELRSLMGASSIVVTSGGLTSLESMCAARPTLVLALNPLQKEVARCFGVLGFGLDGGLFEAELFDRVLLQIVSFLNDPQGQEEFRRRCTQADIRRGPELVVRELESLLG